jgi:prevent-host-death family protein
LKTLELVDATKSLADYAREIEDTVIVTKGGKPVAALVSLEDVDRETLGLSTNRAFLDLIARSRKEHKSKGGIPSEEIRRRFR